jgi:hypothetical protein
MFPKRRGPSHSAKTRCAYIVHEYGFFEIADPRRVKIAAPLQTAARSELIDNPHKTRKLLQEYDSASGKA